MTGDGEQAVLDAFGAAVRRLRIYASEPENLPNLPELAAFQVARLCDLLRAGAAGDDREAQIALLRACLEMLEVQ